MKDRILLKGYHAGNCLFLRTVSAKLRSPHRFGVLSNELIRLEREDRPLILSDLDSFAKLRLEQATGHTDMLVIQFTWLSQSGIHSVTGWKETVRVPYERFHAFAVGNGCEAGETWRLLSVPEPMAPRLVFQSKRNLKAVSSNAVLRHKLGVALHRNFNWRNCEKVIFTDDFVPYSFSFQSYTSQGPDLCGGLILHGQEDLKTSYYGIHT